MYWLLAADVVHPAGHAARFGCEICKAVCLVALSTPFTEVIQQPFPWVWCLRSFPSRKRGKPFPWAWCVQSFPSRKRGPFFPFFSSRFRDSCKCPHSIVDGSLRSDLSREPLALVLHTLTTSSGLTQRRPSLIHRHVDIVGLVRTVLVSP